MSPSCHRTAPPSRLLLPKQVRSRWRRQRTTSLTSSSVTRAHTGTKEIQNKTGLWRNCFSRTFKPPSEQGSHRRAEHGVHLNGGQNIWKTFRTSGTDFHRTHSNDSPVSFGALLQSSERHNSVFAPHRIRAAGGTTHWNGAGIELLPTTSPPPALKAVLEVLFWP